MVTVGSVHNCTVVQQVGRCKSKSNHLPHVGCQRAKLKVQRQRAGTSVVSHALQLLDLAPSDIGAVISANPLSIFMFVSISTTRHMFSSIIKPIPTGFSFLRPVSFRSIGAKIRSCFFSHLVSFHLVNLDTIDQATRALTLGIVALLRVCLPRSIQGTRSLILCLHMHRNR